MAVHQSSFVIETGKAPDIRDITEEVQQAVSGSGIQNGIAMVFAMHTTVAIRINEWEDGLIADLKKFLSELVPARAGYQHDNLACRASETLCDSEECLNGHSHIIQMLLDTSVSIPVKNGELFLGKWQRILLIELSDPRKRTVSVTVIGE